MSESLSRISLNNHFPAIQGTFMSHTNQLAPQPSHPTESAQANHKSGSAFPFAFGIAGQGLTRLDYFAAKALSIFSTSIRPERVVEHSIKMAVAMVAASDKARALAQKEDFAFPVAYRDTGKGLTRLDYFAAEAMHPDMHISCDANDRAENAFVIAAAMLKACDEARA